MNQELQISRLSKLRRLHRATKIWVVISVTLVTVVAAWRWHETHLPVPVVPSTWVGSSVGSATMIRWVIYGTDITGFYVMDSLDPGNLNNPSCIVAPINGSINGHSVRLNVAFMDGSGSTELNGTVS